MSSILQCHAACVHVRKKSTLWAWRHILSLSSTYHVTNQDCSDHTLLFHSSVIQSWWSLTRSLICLFFADWNGKWCSPLLLQPIQFKVKWCVFSQMTFCTLLLYWAVVYLLACEFEQVSSLTSHLFSWFDLLLIKRIYIAIGNKKLKPHRCLDFATASWGTVLNQSCCCMFAE